MGTQENLDYYVLSLSRKKVSLLKLHNTETEEVHDEIFPMSFTDDYEYAKSSRGSSYGYALKNFEKDKSIVRKERFTHFLRLVNQNLRRYLNDQTALLLTGTTEDRADFKRVSDFNHLIAGEISGSYSSSTLGQLKQAVIESLKK